MKSFFNPDNWFWRGFGRLADYFILSFCWLLCSVPLITVGSACIALYDAAAHSFRYGEGDMVKRFFGTFRRELGRGIALTLLWTLICFVLNAGYQIICQLAAGSSGWTVFSVVYYCTLLIPLGAICWLVTIESRFSHSFLSLHRTAVLFTFVYLPHTLAAVALLVAALNLLLNFPFLIMILPAVLAHLQSFFIEKVFRKHMPEEGTEEIN